MPPCNIWNNLTFSPSLTCETSAVYDSSFLLDTMASADFSPAFRPVRPPQVIACSFLQSLLNLINKHTPFQAFGLHNDVLAHPVYQASYAVSVRQYRSLPVGFLHCTPHGEPTCHLLMLQDVTPAHKSLSRESGDLHPLE